MSRALVLGKGDDRQRPTDAPGTPTCDFFLSDAERSTGVHVIGAPNSGKSKFLEHLIRQDIRDGRGLCLIDPHGALYDDVMEWCAFHYVEHRDIIPLNVADGRHVIGFNPFAGGTGDDTHTRVNRCVAATVRAWGVRDADETPRLRRWLQNTYTAIIENRLTIAEARHLFWPKDAEVRDFLTARLTDDVTRHDWTTLAAAPPARQDEQTESTRNRLDKFLKATSLLRFMALSSAATLDLRAVMDRGAVLLVNLRPGATFDREDARVFGSLLVSEFFAVAARRGGPGQPKPRPFYLYCDEFQNFVSPDVAEILPQGRKFGLSLILAHQFLGQLDVADEQLGESVMAAARTKVAFGGISADDAARMVPALFAGQIDYHETKRIDRTKGRATTDATGHSHTEARGSSQTDATGTSHTDAASRGGGSGFGSGLVESSGWTSPSVGATLAAGSTFAGSSHGRSESGFDMSSDSKADTTSEAHAETTSESSADTTSVAHAETTSGSETERPWSLDELLQRLAATLMRQQQRRCFVKPRDRDSAPVEVPIVKRHRQPPESVAAYEADMARKAGAIAPEQADAVIADRTLQITHDAREFFDRSRAEALKSQEHDLDPPLKRQRRAKQSRQA